VDVSQRRAKAAMIALAVAAFCYVTTEVIPIGLLTVISDDLHRSRSQTGLLVTGYAVLVVVASVPLARLTQHVPRRILLGVTLGVFALATFATAVAPTYEVLLIARLVIALTQSMFWGVMATTATGMFPPARHGWVIARLSLGNSLAPVLGVPIGTWLGQQAGWRAAFAVIAAVNLLTFIAVTFLVPMFAPELGTSARAPEPNARRFGVIVLVTAIAITGFLTTYTYITPFLLDVSHFSRGALAPILFCEGVVGVLGAILVGRILDRRPWFAMLAPLSLLTGCLLGLYVLGAVKLVALVLVCLCGLAASAFPPALQARTLRVAPGSTDVASAAISTAFNVGIASGSFVGGLLIASVSTRSVALLGGAFAAAALAVLLFDLRAAHRTGALAGAPALTGSSGPPAP
jgi:predicted MFS family arabinose efflux permease